MKTIKIGLIGCGAFAHAQHLPNCQKNPKAEIIWACDIFEESAKKAAEKYNIKNITTDEDDIFNDPEVDLVILATSHEAHLPLITKAARHKKHVFCEKPLGMELDEVYKIVREVRSGDIKLCVDYNRRAAPSLEALKEKYIAHKKNSVHQPWRYTEQARKPLREELYTNFLIRIQDESLSYRLVHLDPQFGGGQIIGESVHWLDLMSWLFMDDEPVKLQAWGSSSLSHGINVEFRSGDSGTLLFNTGGSFDYPKELFEITHNGALFRNECFLENNIYGVKGASREVFPLQRDPLPEVGKEGGMPGYMQKLSQRQTGENSKADWDSLSFDKGHENMLDQFLNAIIEDTTSPCSELDGFRATYLAKLAQKSIELGQPVPVEMKHWHPLIFNR